MNIMIIKLLEKSNYTTQTINKYSQPWIIDKKTKKNILDDNIVAIFHCDNFESKKIEN